MSSEGTVLRNGQNVFELSSAMSTQAADGMRLERSHTDVVADMKYLPSASSFVKEIGTLLDTLKQLRAAPVVSEEYSGPVLLSADAAASVFASMGDNVLGLRPDLGQPARTKGPFASSYRARVLPEFLTVIDDPTRSEIDGQPLLGKYDIDDEGVRAQRVTVIDKGVLVNYLTGREPIRDFPVSNGHGRAKIPENNPGPSIGNLIVQSSAPVPNDQLKQKVIELCRQRGLSYGYYVETFGPKLVPRLLYRLWVNDGHMELVRGGSFGDLDERALRNNLIAAGDSIFVDSQALNIPHSTVSVAVLFDELQVKPSNVNKESLPEYPSPPAMK